MAAELNERSVQCENWRQCRWKERRKESQDKIRTGHIGLKSAGARVWDWLLLGVDSKGARDHSITHHHQSDHNIRA